MIKLRWRQVGSFIVALACATGALVEAGISEDARGQDARATRAFQPR